MKPVALVADAMRDCAKRRGLVLDSFMGSGTTIMAGEKVGRRVYGIECDPAYVDAAVRRWQAFTGKDAVLEDRAETFEEVAVRRRTEAASPGQETTAAAQKEGACSIETPADIVNEAPEDNGWVRLCQPQGGEG